MPGISEAIFGDDLSRQRQQQAEIRQMLEGIRNTGGSIMDNGLQDLLTRLLPFTNNVGAGAEQDRQLFGGVNRDVMNGDNPNNANTFYGQNPSSRGITPEMLKALGIQGGISDNQGGLGDLSGKVFAGGGWSNQSQNVFDQLDAFRKSGGSNDAMRNLAMQVIQGGGANPYSNFTVDKGTEALNRGGATSQSNSLQNFGQQGLESKGQTPWDQLALGAAQQGLSSQGFNQNSNALSNTGQGLLASGGKTGDNQFLNSRGREILGKDPLLSMESAAGMAADKAGSMFANNSAQNYEQAMKRGGGPAVRSGLQNQGVQEGEDEQLRAVGDAVTNARLGQQGLQLQQFGQGKDIMGEGMQNELAKLLQGGQFTGQGEQAALQRMLGLTGLGNSSSDRALNAQQLYSQMLGQSGQLSNQNMQTVGGLGMQGLEAANAKLGLGMGMLQNTQGNDLGALNQYMSNLGQQNNYALGAGNLSNSAYGQQNNTQNSIYGNNLAGGQFGQQRMNDEYGAFGKNLDRGINNTNAQQGRFLEGLNPIANVFNQGANMYSGAGANQAGLFQQGRAGDGFLNTAVKAGGDIAATVIKMGAS